MINFKGYAPDQNSEFFESGGLDQRTPPFYDAQLVLPKRGVKPQTTDNRIVRDWLSKLGVFSYSQLLREVPEMDDIFTGCSILDGSTSARLPLSKALMFEALMGMDDIHKDTVQQLYLMDGNKVNERYIRYSTSVIQVTSLMVSRYISGLTTE